MKQTPELSFHTTQTAYEEISVKCLSQGHNDVMPSTGIEPANLRSLAHCSNQLSYAAVFPSKKKLEKLRIKSFRKKNSKKRATFPVFKQPRDKKVF